MADKVKQDKVLPSEKRKHSHISLHPLEFEEAVADILQVKPEKRLGSMTPYNGHRVKVTKSERFPSAVGVTGRAFIVGGRGGFISHTDKINDQPFLEPHRYRIEPDNPIDGVEVEGRDFSEDELELLN